jgi:hypothetical protein
VAAMMVNRLCVSTITKKAVREPVRRFEVVGAELF